MMSAEWALLQKVSNKILYHTAILNRSLVLYLRNPKSSSVFQSLISSMAVQ